MGVPLRFLFCLAFSAALPAYAAEEAVEVPLDMAVRAAFEVCPAMIARGGGMVSKNEIGRFKLQGPFDGGDRTLWPIGEPTDAFVLAWLPNRQECSVMYSGKDQLVFLQKLEDELSDLDGYVRTAQEDDGKYLTQIFNGASTSDIEATHYVIVKTNDGRWVNVWYGKGAI